MITLSKKIGSFLRNPLFTDKKSFTGVISLFLLIKIDFCRQNVTNAVPLPNLILISNVKKHTQGPFKIFKRDKKIVHCVKYRGTVTD